VLRNFFCDGVTIILTFVVVVVVYKKNYRNVSSYLDLHTNAGSASDNLVTLTFDLLTPGPGSVLAERLPCTVSPMSTKFGVDSSSRFSYKARTQTDTHVTGATDHTTHWLPSVYRLGKYSWTADVWFN